MEKTRITITPTPFDRTGRILITVLRLQIAVILILGVYLFVVLPAEVPTHFAFSGTPDARGSKILFLFLPLAFAAGPSIILVMTRFRFTLFNRYPYLLNLPSFYANIGRIAEERRGYWLNRYFEVILTLGVGLGVFLLLMLLGVYNGVVEGQLPRWFTFAALFAPILVVGPLVYSLSRLSKQMSEELF